MGRGRVEGPLRPPSDTPYGLREFGYVVPDGNLLRVTGEFQGTTDLGTGTLTAADPTLPSNFVLHLQP